MLLSSGLTVPTDPYWANVVLLYQMSGANGSTTFTDSSTAGTNGTSVNGAALTTANFQFAPSSFRSNVGPSAPYITFSNTNLSFGTSPVTVDCWLYYSSSEATDFGPILDNGGQGIYLSYGNVNTNLLFFSANSGGLGSNVGVAHGMTNNTWNFISFVRNGSTCYIFVNGTIIQTITGVTATLSPASGSLAYINTYSGTLGSTYWLGGNLQELRITKGIARYTSNFTPPTGPFPTS